MINPKDVIAFLAVFWFFAVVPVISYEYLQLEKAASSSVECHAD